MLRCILWVFFTGGGAHLVSIAMDGIPPPLIIARWLGEFLPPPILVWWLSRVEHAGSPAVALDGADMTASPAFKVPQARPTGERCREVVHTPACRYSQMTL